MIRAASGLVAIPLLTIAVTLAAPGQPKSRPAVLPVDSLAWIAGHWLACDRGTRHEGVWMGPSAGALVGLFMVSEGGRMVRYDLLLIEKSDSGPVLSRKPFGPSLSPGSDEDQWTRLRLREYQRTKARFSPSTPAPWLSVVIERTAEDRLRVTVERMHEGNRLTESVEYTRLQP